MNYAPVFIAACAMASSGCIYNARYHPAGDAWFLVVPGVGEWVLDENKPPPEVMARLKRQPKLKADATLHPD
jgi:hypothetical protein